MPERQKMSTGERIRLIRHDLGLSQQGLASKVGMAKAMIGQYETGNREPKVPALTALADAMGCSFTWLATGGGNPRDAEPPNAALLEACVEVALGTASADDVPARAAALYSRARGAGLGLRKETRAGFIPLVRALLGPR